MHLQKDKIVSMAIALLDRDGLEGVTLRRLAKELNAQAASLYYHLPHKEALLGTMANAILDEHFATYDLSDDRLSWEDWLDRLGHGLRTAMLAHREGGRVVAGAFLGDVMSHLFDFTIRVLQNAGFDPMKASTITVTVTYFVFGFVIEEQAAPETPGEMSPPLKAFERFPALSAVMEQWAQQDYSVHFETSMRILINGVRAEQG